MELHCLINPTMRPLAEGFFLPSVPNGFDLINHYMVKEVGVDVLP
jgi:hypothetical protein